jgi:2-keto-4-pentenoate hydratase/2-oxohepta-3-ene-1,7-dioic acid hydratase in catechol pathway
MPQYPVIFMKPADALIGSDTPISAHPSCQSILDYEGEVTVIISRNCKNLSPKFALEDVVLGYTAGDNISARNFQLPAFSGGQFCYAKSFDGFAPIGPAIVTPALVPDPQALRYVTRVNGKVRQQTGTDDMYWMLKPWQTQPPKMYIAVALCLPRQSSNEGSFNLINIGA